MPRCPRIQLEDAVYSIQMDGPSGASIYRDAEDHQKYLNILAQTKQELPFKLFAYALLPDRLHLLIETFGEHSISQIMQKITPNYTKYYNAKYGCKGHLFPKRFRSVYVERGAYLAKLTRYIHLLPQTAGVTANFRDHAYSSFGVYSGKVDFPMKEETAEVIASLGSAHAEDPYERFVLSADSQELEFLEKKLSRGSFLGSQEFVQKVRRQIADHAAVAKAPVVPAAIAAQAPEVHAEVSPVMIARTAGRRVVFLPAALCCAIALSLGSVAIEQSTRKFSPAVVAAVKQDPQSQIVARATPFTFKTPIVGTVWEVKIFTVTKDGTTQPITDKIRFNGREFESYYFSTQGFSPSNYTVRVRENGAVTWETMQRNGKGEIITWRGDLEGGRMEGVMSYQPQGQNAQDFSFLSNDIVRLNHAQA